MLTRTRSSLAICTAIFLASSPQIAAAEIFKGSEFLKWERDSQEFYIRTSVGMASLIIGQTDKAQSKCVDDWYYANEKTGNDHILDAMSKHPDFHPRGVILAVMEKKCGEFSYVRK